MKLIAFAYAGGDGHVYYKMRNALSEYGIKLIPYMYKGRGSRVTEEPYISIYEAGEEAAEFIKKNIAVNEDYILLGHSMGSIIAFECYQNLLKINYNLPNKIIFSGQYPPDKLNKLKYDLNNDKNLVQQLSKLGAVSTDLLSIPEFKNTFLPLIRNDLKLIKEYIYKDSYKIIVPITILNGNQDDLILDRLKGWEKHTTQKTTYIDIDGNHFFLFKHDMNYEFIARICFS
ncbi:thioesterase II family protein [Staphylococcus aureus]|uniref:thioesterase II family protein n=1 Tax=Staphylococcus aureus TaxID=1280 RepID=UPI001245E8B0|nr:thioesterase domain-containing protein [Staphylococcus aureus]